MPNKISFAFWRVGIFVEPVLAVLTSENNPTKSL
jgi:hypothetical protein